MEKGLRTAIHDWREGQVHPDDLTWVAVGAPASDSRDTWEDATIAWVGPAEDGEAARKAALEDAKLAWTVAHALTGLGPAELPERLSYPVCVENDGDHDVPGVALL